MILPCPMKPCPWHSDDVDGALVSQQLYDHIENFHSDQNNKQVEDLDTGQTLR